MAVCFCRSAKGCGYALIVFRERSPEYSERQSVVPFRASRRSPRRNGAGIERLKREASGRGRGYRD